jgi:copper chaperone CopZ
MTTSTYYVSSMTCAHCVAAVTQELSTLDGVEGVTVELVPGGDSRVTVRSATPISEEAVREAVDEAGYQVTGTAT